MKPSALAKNLSKLLLFVTSVLMEATVHNNGVHLHYCAVDDDNDEDVYVYKPE